jgi:hypothetical protein
MPKTTSARWRLPDRLELLVPVAGDLRGGNHRRGHLHGHLVPRRAALDLGPGGLGSMGAINLIAVKAFGEFEFWFALIKIVTIIAMVVAASA